MTDAQKTACEFLARATANVQDGDVWNGIEYALRAVDYLGQDDPDFAANVANLIRQINGGF